MSFAHLNLSAFGRSFRVGIVAAGAVLAISVPAGLAQEASPVATAGDSHPAHIHAGTCAELGDVVVPLTNLEEVAGEAVGPESAFAIDTSTTYVDLPLADIIAGGHAINVHLSDEEIGTYIACGDIGGVLVADDSGGDGLVIGLGELNDSGYAGMAWLGETADGQTEVAVQVIEPDELD